MVNKIGKILKKTKSILIADPQLLYKEEVELINQPFSFKGTNGKAVLLIHGWTSTPYEVRRLGQYLNENGYSVYGPLLCGHGTMPKNLEDVKWNDWLDDIKKEYQRLQKEYEKVFIGGTSIGSCLAIMLAKKNPEISGLILMATPYQLKLEKISTWIAKLMLIFKKYNRKHYPPTFGLSTTITRIISYQSYPIASGLETFKLIEEARKELFLINQPCFLLQSSSDHLVKKKSMDAIYNQIGSKVKKMKYIKRAYHTFISDIKNKSVFEEILNFIEEN
jgi:carboxylesterase